MANYYVPPEAVIIDEEAEARLKVRHLRMLASTLSRGAQEAKPDDTPVLGHQPPLPAGLKALIFGGR